MLEGVVDELVQYLPTVCWQIVCISCVAIYLVHLTCIVHVHNDTLEGCPYAVLCVTIRLINIYK